MPTVLTGARILTPDDEIEGGGVIVEDGRIAEVAAGVSPPAGAGGGGPGGRFASPERRGALPEGWLRPPDAALLGRLLEAAGGRLRLITLAPELPGAAAPLEQAARAGCGGAGGPRA